MKTTNSSAKLFPIFLVGYELANYLCIDASLPAMPAIAQELAVPSYQVQFTITVFFLGNLIAQFILGPISERYGHRSILLIGGLIFLAATLLAILSPTIHGLVIARFFQGLAVMSMIVAGYSTIHAIYDQHQAIKTLAWMGRISMLAPALGPLFGVLILLVANWQWIFIILLIWAALCLYALFKVMPETYVTHVPLTLRQILGQYWQVLRDWDFIRPTLPLCLMFAAMMAWGVAGPFLVVTTLHYSALIFALLQILIFTFFILGSYLVKPLITQYPLPKVAKICITIAGLGGQTGLILETVNPHSLFNIIIPMCFITLGLGIGYSVLNRMAVESSGKSLGIKVALFTFCTGLSAFLITMITSSFFSAKTHNFILLLFFLSLFTLLIGYYSKSNSTKDSILG